MNRVLRLFILSAAASLTLTACKPSADKSPASQVPASPTAPREAPAAPAATNSQQPVGTGEYALLATPQPAEKGRKVEVLEFFAYFCSHCKTFDPVLHAWAKKNADKVVFKRVPVAFRDNMAPQQRMYYALDAMGKIEQVHAQAFAAVQDERKPLASDREIIDFVAKQGIDANRFKALYDSFSVQSQARNAMNQQTAYRIDSVPTIAIDGRYITSVSHATKRPGVAQTEAGLQAATLQIMDELVARTLKERAAGK